MFQRSELALRLKPQLSKEAKERQGERVDLKDNIVEKLPQSTVRDQLGEIAGVSGKTIDNVEKILKEGTPEDITEVREISFSSYLRNSV